MVVNPPLCDGAGSRRAGEAGRVYSLFRVVDTMAKVVRIATNQTTEVPLEFCLLQGEIAEAFEAWRRSHEDLGEELADVAIYLLSLAEMTGVDLQAAVTPNKHLRAVLVLRQPAPGHVRTARRRATGTVD